MEDGRKGRLERLMQASFHTNFYLKVKFNLSS